MKPAHRAVGCIDEGLDAIELAIEVLRYECQGSDIARRTANTLDAALPWLHDARMMLRTGLVSEVPE